MKHLSKIDQQLLKNAILQVALKITPDSKVMANVHDSINNIEQLCKQEHAASNQLALAWLSVLYDGLAYGNWPENHRDIKRIKH